MTEWYFPTAFAAHGAEERAAIDRVIRSDRLTMGPETEAFEAELAAHVGRKHAVMVNSGSSANLVAVAALTEHFNLRGDPYIVVPAVAWSTTYAPLIQQDLSNLLLLDVDDTWNVKQPALDDVGALDCSWKIASCPIPRLLVSVPVLGNPAYLPEWHDVTLEPNIPILVDACESLGAAIDGRSVASYGDVATVSFFWSHQLSAYEGGAALTDDDEMARTMRLLRDHGNAGWGAGDFDRSYDFRLFGYNLRPHEVNAAVARVQLRKLGTMCEERRKNAALFRELTAGLPVVHPRLAGVPAPFGLAFTVESKEVRARLVAALRAAGVDARLPTGGSFIKHFYGAPWRDQRTPNADRIHDTGLFCGCAPFDISARIEKLVDVMKRTI